MRHTARLIARRVTVTVTAQPPAPAVAIPTGTWTVGTDIAPGVYKVIAAITQRCYWAITKTGSNGDDIVGQRQRRGWQAAGSP